VSEARIKPQAKYKAGFLLFCGKRNDSSITGQMLPQPIVATTQGQRILLDEILGTGFALLRCHHNSAEAFASLKTDFWERLGTRFVCIQPGVLGHKEHNAIHREYSYENGHELSRGKTPLVVVQANGRSFSGYFGNLFIVVRPDRYILGVFREEKADTFVAALQGLLQKRW
ncbi:MAG TPA: hypothetical protein VIY29_24640, partial [Ktedonobacteraceae bacterium]